MTEVNLGGSPTRWADFNRGLLAGNVLVIAAKTDETGDGFKLSKLDVVCGSNGQASLSTTPLSLAGLHATSDLLGRTSTELVRNSSDAILGPSQQANPRERPGAAGAMMFHAIVGGINPKRDNSRGLAHGA